MWYVCSGEKHWTDWLDVEDRILCLRIHGIRYGVVCTTRVDMEGRRHEICRDWIVYVDLSVGQDHTGICVDES